MPTAARSHVRLTYDVDPKGFRVTVFRRSNTGQVPRLMDLDAGPGGRARHAAPAWIRAVDRRVVRARRIT
jgi:hypothetical protein